MGYTIVRHQNSATIARTLGGRVEHLVVDRGHRTYLKNPEFPMTNNLAEEALRNLVIARKLCFGSRSEYGKRWRESLHSCIETLKRQGQSILDFLAETIQQARMGACHCTLSKEERLAAS